MGMGSVGDPWKATGSGRNSRELHSVSYLLRSGLVPSCPGVGLASGRAVVLNATLKLLPEQLREASDHCPLPQHCTSVNATHDHMCFFCPIIMSHHYWTVVLHTKLLFTHSFLTNTY